MKKVLLTIMLTLGCIFANALPEQPAVIPNMEERDKGYWCANEIGGGSTVMDNMKIVAMAVAFGVNALPDNTRMIVPFWSESEGIYS